MIVVFEELLTGAEDERMNHQQVRVDQCVRQQRANHRPLPMITRSPGSVCFSSATLAGMSPCTTVEFGQPSVVAKLVETTYFGAVLSASFYGPPRTFQLVSICS